MRKTGIVERTGGWFIRGSKEGGGRKNTRQKPRGNKGNTRELEGGDEKTKGTRQETEVPREKDMRAKRKGGQTEKRQRQRLPKKNENKQIEQVRWEKKRRIPEKTTRPFKDRMRVCRPWEEKTRRKFDEGDKPFMGSTGGAGGKYKVREGTPKKPQTKQANRGLTRREGRGRIEELKWNQTEKRVPKSKTSKKTENVQN